MRRAAWLLLAVALYAGLPAVLGGKPYFMSLIVASLTLAGLSLSWALLGNLGGMVSFGHAAFFGVGSYVSALLAMRLGVPVFACIVAGGVGSAIASLLMVPALRLRGPYFALAILAYAHIFRIVATQWQSVTNGAGGLASIPGLPAVAGFDFGSKSGSYLVILSIVAIFVLVYARVRASHHGLALLAMHDAEEATRTVGVNSTALKAAMLLLSAFMAGMVGAFNAHYIGFLEPDYAFSGAWTTIPIVAAIFGGYRTLAGPVIGAVALYLVDQLLFKNLISSGHQIVFGLLLAAMILWSPDGLLPALRRVGARRAHAAA